MRYDSEIGGSSILPHQFLHGYASTDAKKGPPCVELVPGEYNAEYVGADGISNRGGSSRG